MSGSSSSSSGSPSPTFTLTNPGTQTYNAAGVPTNITVTASGWTTVYMAVFPSNVTASPGSYTPQTSTLSNVLFVVDPALPPTTATLVAGTPALQVDASNNVQGVVDPVSGSVLARGYGAISYVPPISTAKPFFRGTSASYETAYDSFVFSTSAATELFGLSGQAWCMMFVMRQTGVSTCLMRCWSSTANINFQPISGATDGAMHMEQNNGAAICNETSSSVTALHQLQVVTLLCDGSTFSIYRNGTRTVQSPAGTIGGLSGITNFEILNNPEADVYYVQMSLGAPDISQLNTEMQRFASHYGITSPGTITVGPANPVAPSTVDNTQAWMTSPNFPASDNLPTEATPTLHDGLELAAGAVSLAAVTFTPGGTTDTRTKLDAQMYYNPFTGNQNNVLGSDGIEGVTTCYARVRRYPDGNQYNLHTFDATGLSLNAIASKNNTAAGISNGNVYGGMIRCPTKILPGMTISVKYRTPTSEIAWCPVWLYEGGQNTPGPGGSPYTGYGTTSSLIQAESNSNNYYEYDINDGYWRPGYTQGTQFNTSFVNEKSSTFTIQPYDTYLANGPEFKYQSTQNPPFIQLVSDGSVNTSTSFNTLVMNWRDDGSNLVDILFNGKLFRQQYWSYTPSTYTDASGVVHQVPMHLLIGNQAIPDFLPSADQQNLVPQDGGVIAGGPWSLTLQEIKIIKGNLTAASLAAATTDANAVSIAWDTSALAGQNVRELRGDQLITYYAPGNVATVSSYGAFAGQLGVAYQSYSGSTSQQPTLVTSGINSLPALSFGGSAYMYVSAGNSMLNVYGRFTNAARFVVFQTSATTSGCLFFETTGSGGLNRFSLMINPTGTFYATLRHGDSDTGTTFTTSTAFNDGKPHAVCVWANGTSLEIIVDGVVQPGTLQGSLTSAAFASTNAQYNYLGWNQTYYYTGLIAHDLTVVNPTQAQIASTMGYFAKRYGITMTYSSGYATQNPTMTTTTASLPAATGVLTVASSTFTTQAFPTSSDGMQALTQDGTYLYALMETSTGGQPAEANIFNLSTKALAGTVKTANSAFAPHSGSADMRTARSTIITSGAGDSTAAASYILESSVTISTTAGKSTLVRGWNANQADSNGVTVPSGSCSAFYVGEFNSTSHLQLWVSGTSTVTTWIALVLCLDSSTTTTSAHTILKVWLGSDQTIQQDGFYADGYFYLAGDNTNNVQGFVKKFTLPGLAGAMASSTASSVPGYYLVTSINLDPNASSEIEGLCANPAGGFFSGHGGTTSIYEVTAAAGT